MALGEKSDEECPEVTKLISNLVFEMMDHAKLIKFTSSLVDSLEKVKNKKEQIKEGFCSLLEDLKVEA